MDSERAVWATLVLLLILLVATLGLDHAREDSYRVRILFNRPALSDSRPTEGLSASDFHRSLSGSPHCVRSNAVAARADG